MTNVDPRVPARVRTDKADCTPLTVTPGSVERSYEALQLDRRS